MECLVGKSTAELEDLAARVDEPALRGRQVARWIYRRGVSSFDDMTDLPKSLRSALAERWRVRSAGVIGVTRAADDVAKLAVRFPAAGYAECVRIPSQSRTTVCVSTQVGCSVGCVFCASGQSGLQANLTAGQILEQVLFALDSRDGDIAQASINVVYMGMGEPFLNYDSTLRSIRLLRSEMGIGARSITVSTIGLPGRIRQFAEDEPQVKLAISLHAATDELRRQLIPRRCCPLRELLGAARDYIALTNRRVSFEYVLLRGVNDARGHVRRLGEMLRGMLCHVNVIRYNAMGADFRAPTRRQSAAFCELLQQEGVNATLRASRGGEAEAACGQLRARLEAGDKEPHSVDA
ncbi:MAG: 23S rRNA (adenine(2503)-C(2))-methyltransferase RlmN [Armatimonadota bacterium]|jgi:23S rRNA (adenine2503-C2)-methyltransferase